MRSLAMTALIGSFCVISITSSPDKTSSCWASAWAIVTTAVLKRWVLLDLGGTAWTARQSTTSLTDSVVVSGDLDGVFFFFFPMAMMS